VLSAGRVATTSGKTKLKLVTQADETCAEIEDLFASGPTEPSLKLKVGTVEGGSRVGQYEITELRAKGGMGCVYAGVEPTARRRVAIKILNASLSQDPTVVRRFLQEAHAVNKIDHPNVVDIYSVGQLANGQPYIVMEFLEGETLASRLDRMPPMRAAEAFEILIQVCDALAAAHGRGIVHRDVKPENIFLAETKGGLRVAKLLDFGLAKLLVSSGGFEQPQTGLGVSLGTPLYMTPEQIRGEAVDGRTDVYALGLILFEMFTGQHPFMRPTLREILNAQLREAPPRSAAVEKLPHELVKVILDCLEKDPDARPSGVHEIRDRLRAIAACPSLAKLIAKHTTVGLVPTLEERTWRVHRPSGWHLKQRRVRVALIAAVVLALAGALIGWSFVRSAPKLATPAATSR
jgi:serine/threonine protein kinase